VAVLLIDTTNPMHPTFKNLRLPISGQIAKVKMVTEAAIINALDARLWDKIEVIGDDYHYVVIIQDNKLHLRPVYH